MELNKKNKKMLEICGSLFMAFLIFWPVGFILYKYFEKKEKKILLSSQKPLKVVGWFNLFFGILGTNSDQNFWIILILFIAGYILAAKNTKQETDIKLSQEKIPFLGYGLCGIAVILCMLSVTGDSSYLGCLYFIMGGLLPLYLAIQLKIKEIRFQQYLTCVLDQGITSIVELSLAFQNNPADVVEILNEMLQAQYFGNAYIDQVRQALVFPHREYVNTGSKNSANGVQSENTEVVVCKNCGGNNTILVGQVCECEFCGSPISISKKK